MTPRLFPALVAALMLMPGLAARGLGDDDGPLTLPHWSKEEIEAMRTRPTLPPTLGVLVGSDDSAQQDNLVPRADDTTPVADSPEKTQPHTDLSRFLPLSLFSLRQTHPASRPEILEEVAVSSLLENGQKPPGAHLVDPGHELSETTVEDLERFLAHHADDSHLPLTLLIIGRRQVLPAQADLSAFIEGGASAGHSAMVACSYGAVGRTRLFLSRPILDAVSTTYLSSLLEDCVQYSLRASDPDEQLHRLLVRLSVRLHWLQPMLATTPVPAHIVHVREVPAHTEASRALDEVIPFNRGSDAPPVRTWAARLQSGSTLFFLVFLIFGLYGGWRWHRYMMRHYQWLLPEPETSPALRFGGRHSGGGVAIRYR